MAGADGLKLRHYQACSRRCPILLGLYPISDAQKLLPGFGPDATDDPWFDQNEKMARLLREFQVAAREELEIGGVDRSHMLDRAPRKYL